MGATSHTFKTRFIAICVAVVLAAIGVILLIDRGFVSPFEDSRALGELYSVEINDEGTCVAVSRRGETAAIVDANGVLLSVIDVPSNYVGADSCWFSSGYVSDGSVYLVAEDYSESESDSKVERVLRYDMHGNLLETLSTFRGSIPYAQYSGESILRVFVIDGAVYDITSQEGATQVCVVKHGINSATSVYRTNAYAFNADYNPVSDTIAIVDSTGFLTVRRWDGYQHILAVEGDPVFVDAAVADDGMIYAADQTNSSILKIDKEGNSTVLLDGIVCTRLSYSNGYLVANDTVQGGYLTYDLASGAVERVQYAAYTPLQRFHNVFESIGLLCAALLAVALAFALLYYNRHQFTSEKLGTAFMIGVTAIMLTTVTGFFITRMHENTATQEREQLIATTQFLTVSSGWGLCDYVEQYDLEVRNDDTETLYVWVNALQAREYLTLLCDAYKHEGYEIFADVYQLNEDGTRCYYLCGTQDDYPMGSSWPISESMSVLMSDSGVMVETVDEAAGYYTLLSPIYTSEGNVRGFLSMSMDTQSELWRWKLERFEILSALLVFLCAQLLIMVEGRAIVRSLREAIQARRRNIRTSNFGTIRALAFVIGGLTSADSVLMVLIGEYLLKTLGYPTEGVFLALPLFMTGVGTVLGPLAFIWGIRRTSFRRLTGFFSILAIVSGLGISFALENISFWGYCAGKLLLGLSLAALACVPQSLAMRFDEAHERFEAISVFSKGTVAGGVLSVLVYGYVAQYLGYKAVYTGIAIFAIGLLVLVSAVLPRRMDGAELFSNVRPDGKYATDAVKHAVRRLMSTPAALISLFLALAPFVFLEGYESCLFPLFSDEVGFEESNITNCVVVAHVVAYLLAKLSHLSYEHFGQRVTVFLCLLTLAIGFGCFIVTKGIVWAVVVIFLVVCLVDFGMENLSLRWSEIADSCQISRIAAMMVQRSVMGMAKVATPMILGLFYGLGGQVACGLIGFIVLVNAIAFEVLSKRFDPVG